MAIVRLRTVWMFGISLLALFNSPLPCRAQERPVQIVPRLSPAATPDAPSGALLRVDTSLVLVPVHVTTASGSSVTDLRKENFALYEDGVERPISHFAIDEAPVSVGVLLDVSGSMKNKIREAGAAASSFLKSSNAEDEFFLVEFNERARLRVPFTRDWRGIEAFIARAKPFGLTSLFDALHMALGQMKQAKNSRRAVVILSDGGDNFSRRNLRQMRDTLMEAGVQVYSLGIFDADSSKRPAEERRGRVLLDQVALQTGGQEFPLRDSEGMADIGTRLARDMRDQYLLGYSPADSARDGKYHRLTVRLQSSNAADLRAYYRQGYYAPAW